MPEDNYGMFEDAEMEAPRKSETPMEGGEETGGGQTSLLPLNAFGGQPPSVGDTVTFRVVSVQDDQVEVEYSTGGEEETEEYAETEEKPPIHPPAPEMASMME